MDPTPPAGNIEKLIVVAIAPLLGFLASGWIGAGFALLFQAIIVSVVGFYLPRSMPNRDAMRLSTAIGVTFAVPGAIAVETLWF